MVGRFIYQPVAGPLDDDSFDHIGNQPTLLNEEFARSLFAGEHQHRHLELLPGEAGEVLSIALEGAEHLEAGLHRARLRVSVRVELAILLCHRPGRVGREVIPEMLQIDALTTLNEREGRLAVKMKMPEIPQQPDARPIT